MKKMFLLGMFCAGALMFPHISYALIPFGPAAFADTNICPFLLKGPDNKPLTPHSTFLGGRSYLLHWTNSCGIYPPMKICLGYPHGPNGFTDSSMMLGGTKNCTNSWTLKVPTDCRFGSDPVVPRGGTIRITLVSMDGKEVPGGSCEVFFQATDQEVGALTPPSSKQTLVVPKTH
jgi:hypothetical protein